MRLRSNYIPCNKKFKYLGSKIVFQFCIPFLFVCKSQTGWWWGVRTRLIFKIKLPVPNTQVAYLEDIIIVNSNRTIHKYYEIGHRRCRHQFQYDKIEFKTIYEYTINSRVLQSTHSWPYDSYSDDVVIASLSFFDTFLFLHVIFLSNCWLTDADTIAYSSTVAF